MTIWSTEHFLSWSCCMFFLLSLWLLGYCSIIFKNCFHKLLKTKTLLTIPPVHILLFSGKVIEFHFRKFFPRCIFIQAGAQLCLETLWQACSSAPECAMKRVFICHSLKLITMNDTLLKKIRVYIIQRKQFERSAAFPCIIRDLLILIFLCIFNDLKQWF